jgi:hypothetical protein
MAGCGEVPGVIEPPVRRRLAMPANHFYWKDAAQATLWHD